MEAGTMTRTLEESRAFFADDRFAMEACGITIDEVTERIFAILDSVAK